MAEQPGAIRSAAPAARSLRPFEPAAASPPAKARRPVRTYHALLTQRDAAELTFEIFGAVCRRDEFGEHFNFPQRWVPYPGVAMNALLSDSPQTLALALNVLDHYFRLTSKSAGRLSPNPTPLARRLTKEFAEEILAPLAGSTWHLPLESIAHWVKGRG